MIGTLDDEKQKRELIAKDVDSEWLARYDIIKSRKDTALVKLQDGTCRGCYMKLPPAAVQAVQKYDKMTFCDFCGRMLYQKTVFSDQFLVVSGISVISIFKQFFDSFALIGGGD